MTIRKLFKRKIMGVFDFIRYHFFKVSNNKKTKDPVIIFICETNMPRLGRLLKYLSKIRVEQLHVFVREDKFFNKFSSPNSKIIYHTYRNKFDLKFQLNHFSCIKLIHGIESRSIYPSVGLNYKDTPFIFDFQDLYTIYFDSKPTIKWVNENLPYEQKCLKESDGFISYSLELIPARKKLHLKTKNVVYFPFYLDDENCLVKSEYKRDNNFRLVYAGNVSSIESKDSFNLTLIAENFRNTNIFLHVFPSPNIFPNTLKDYKKYSLENPNLIIEESVAQNELSKKLNEFDFGFIPFYKTNNFLSDTKFKYSTTLKLFNYIEAGLPIVIFDYTEYQSWIVKHNQIGISVKKEELSNLSGILERTNYNILTENIRTFQQNNLLSKHIYKISNLYNKLIRKDNE